MLSLVTAMGAVVATWLIFGAALVGIGLLLRRCCGASRATDMDAGDLLLSFWLGFAGVVLLLQAWNFILPVNIGSQIIVLALGATGFILSRRELGRWLRDIWPARLGQIVLLALVVSWLANRSIGPGNADDSGLYHYTAILWARSFPVVTGVGNLAAPQAMNNASFLYTAMLDNGPWRGRAEHVANGLLLLALWIQTLRGGWLLVQRRGWLIENVYNAALLPIAFMLAIAKDVSSPKTDLPAGALTLVIGWWFLRLVLHPDDERERGAGRLVALAVLCAAAVCVKVSTLALVGVLGIIALAVWVRGRRAQQRPIGNAIAGAALVVTLLLGTWIGRNVIMSGYPVFPSRVLALDIAHRVPEPAMVVLDDSIRKQTKGGLTIWMHDVAAANRLLSWYAPLIKPPFTTRDEVEGFNWVRSWFFALPLTSPVEIVMPIVLALGAGIAMGMRRGKHGRASPSGGVHGFAPARLALLLAAPPLAGLTFWFFAGPDPRYGWPAAWMLAAFMMALAFAGDATTLSPAHRRWFLVLIIALVVPVFAYRLAVQVLLGRDRPLHEVFVLGPGSDHGFHPRPDVVMTPVTNRWGLTAHVPTGERPYHCWNGPLPCSGWPPLDPDLRLRRAGDLASGFVIDRSATPARPPE